MRFADPKSRKQIAECARLEQWVAAPGFPHYEVSDLGRVRSLGRVIVRRDGRRHTYPGTVLSASCSALGYPTVSLYEDGKRTCTSIHRLVMLAFYGPPTAGRPHVNHKNGIKADNRIENLEYVSPQENAVHAVKTGLMVSPRGEKQGRAVLTSEQVLTLREEVRAIRFGKSRAPSGALLALSKRYGVSRQQIDLISRGGSWRHLQ